MPQMWNAWYIKRTMKDVPEEYKKRWRIENNFKSVEQILCPHMRPKSCDQSLYVLSLYDRVQPVVYGGARNEQGNRDQVGASCQKKI